MQCCRSNETNVGRKYDLFIEDSFVVVFFYLKLFSIGTPRKIAREQLWRLCSIKFLKSDFFSPHYIPENFLYRLVAIITWNRTFFPPFFFSPFGHDFFTLKNISNKKRWKSMARLRFSRDPLVKVHGAAPFYNTA